MANELMSRHPGFFDEMSRRFFEGTQGNLAKTDIRENQKDYVVEAELPGIPKENIHLQYEQGVLTIEASYQNEEQKKDKEGQLIKSERSYGSIKRQFLLDNVKEDDIKAKYQDGVLTITLPKAKPSSDKKKEISIE